MATSTQFVLKGVNPSARAQRTETQDGTQAPQAAFHHDNPRRQRALSGVPNSLQRLNNRVQEEQGMVFVPNMRLLTQRGIEYPEKTNCHCCWDRYPFEERPLGIPIRKEIKWEDKKPIAYYYCELHACGFKCATSYCKDNIAKDSVYKNSLKFLQEILDAVCDHLGIERKKLEDALDWRLLAVVGSGDMPIDTFRSPTSYIAYIRTPNVRLYSAAVGYDRM